MEKKLSNEELTQRIKVLEEQLFIAKRHEVNGMDKSLKTYVSRLEGLNVIGQAILSARLPVDTANAVLKHIRLIVPCSRASVNLFDFEKGQFVALAVLFSGQSRYRSGANLPLESLRDDLQLLKKGKIVHVEDTKSLINPSLHIKNLEKEGLRSFVYVPLIAKDKLIGSLNLGENIPSAFTAEHLQIAKELADIMAIAIEQARLFKWNSLQSKQLRLLSSSLAEAEDRQRKDLASELHDRVGQNLTAININLNVVLGLIPPNADQDIFERLEESLKLLEETTAHVRGVMVELRPQVIDDYGLVAALHWYGQQLSKRSGINVKT